MTREINRPSEGFETLAAQFTKQDIERILTTVNQLREGGRTEDEILTIMKRELAHYSLHTISLLYAMSTGKTIPDDIEPEFIKHETEPKQGTIELTLTGKNPHLQSGELIRHKGATWYVATVNGQMALLKNLSV